MGLDDADHRNSLRHAFAGARPSAVAHSPRPGSVHHGADVGLGRGGGDGATGVQDEATRVAEHGEPFVPRGRKWGGIGAERSSRWPTWAEGEKRLLSDIKKPYAAMHNVP